MRHYIFQENDHRQSLEARFWNCQGTQIAVVAVVTKGIDWAAYIGADRSHREQETLEYTSDSGCKLSWEDAKYFFPDIDLPYRG